MTRQPRSLGNYIGVSSYGLCLLFKLRMLVLHNSVEYLFVTSKKCLWITEMENEISLLEYYRKPLEKKILYFFDCINQILMCMCIAMLSFTLYDNSSRLFSDRLLYAFWDTLLCLKKIIYLVNFKGPL